MWTPRFETETEPSTESPNTSDTNGPDGTSTSTMSQGSDPTPATKLTQHDNEPHRTIINLEFQW